MAEIDAKEIIKKSPNSVFLTSSTFALEGFASFIQDRTWNKVATLVIPIFVGLASFVIRRYIKHFECKRGIITYNNIISGLEDELKSPNTTERKKTKS